ncbi:MAG TPA: hypothetical protein GXZ59_02835 [Clostridiaceae bacterium]|nr:hypothetical protein [Clostridiaceae bacterium]
MSRKLKQMMQFRGRVFSALLILLLILLAFRSLDFRRSPSPEGNITSISSEFRYEIDNGSSGSAVLPHTLRQLDSRTAITVTLNIEAGKHESLLVKTVYSGLLLYADDQLIYEAGLPGSYPNWLLDPPTLLAIVPLPAEAEQLRFEYISPSQRSTLNLPVLMAGNESNLLEYVFHQNSALLGISALMILLGLMSVISSLFFSRSSIGGKPFFYYGLFAIATGCWGLGESNATAFIFPYPVFLYCMAMVSLAALAIPLLSYALLILRPHNPLLIKLGRSIISSVLLLVICLQIFSIKGFVGTLPLIQISAVLGIQIFVFSVIWEHFRYKNPAAKRFALPSIALLIVSTFEYLNYSLRFTNILSLFFLSGTLVFVMMLGMIAMWNARKLIHEAEESRRTAKKLALMRQMSHDMLTPLTHISTNVQMAAREPETAEERLANAQADVMSIADTVNHVLSSENKEEPL